MTAKRYYVVTNPDRTSYFIVEHYTRDDIVVYRGSWQECRQFIGPVLPSFPVHNPDCQCNLCTYEG